MRIFIRLLVSFCAVGMIITVLSSPSFASTEVVRDFTLSPWPQTIYYMAHLSGPDAPYEYITINITAVDEYILYVNGEWVGTDDDWQTVESYKN